jgi:prepilin-type processing-associated H-X9-DG protein/prepilin-type N-terminal cleavage/methylation domain-containing protein
LVDANPAPSGFTIVELLVTIGLISILLAILIPALNKVGVASKQTLCSNNLRQAGTLATSWALAHQGFYPLDGTVLVEPSFADSDSLPEALNDRSKTRYEYIPSESNSNTGNSSQFALSPTPFIAGLALESLGDRRNGLPVDEFWFDHVQQFRQLRILQCPAIDSSSRQAALRNADFAVAKAGPTLSFGISGTGVTNYDPWWTGADYATNGMLLGFDGANLVTPMRGCMASVHNASSTLLMSDCDGGWIRVWSATNSIGGDLSLWDAARMSAADTSDAGPRLDFFRHDKRMNVLFVDGHVQSVGLTAAALAQIWLSRSR